MTSALEIALPLDERYPDGVMLRRLFWFLLGAITALFGYGYMRRQAAEAASRLSTDDPLDAFVDTVLGLKDKVVGMVTGERTMDADGSDLFS